MDGLSRPDYIDIHSHLNFPEYDHDREAVIDTLRDRKMWTITVGTNAQTSQEAVDLAEQYPHLYATIGLHPGDNQEPSFQEDLYKKFIIHKKVVAVGECGLDYSRLPKDGDAEKRRQKNIFEQQIALAIQYGKPLMIHCRSSLNNASGNNDAHHDLLTILKLKKKEYGDALRGNFHFFTSPIEIARQCLDLDFTVSFTGPITFVSAYEDLVRYVPLESIMVETDAPYASPLPFRGARNNPLYVPEIVRKIADIKNMDIDIVQKKMVDNAFDLFFKNS